MDTNDASPLAPIPNSNEKLAAVVAHAGTMVAWILAPLLVYLLKRSDSKYVAYQAMQALLWSLLGSLVSVVTCGIAIPVFLFFHILAAVRASNGEWYEYPLIGKAAHDIVYA